MARVFQTLSVGYDRSLMNTRSMLLRSAGYAVQEAFSPRQALVMASSDLIDVVLICHTVPEDERRALITAIRKQRFLLPVLCISRSDFVPHAEHGCFVVPNAPDRLLAAVHSAVGGMLGMSGIW